MLLNIFLLLSICTFCHWMWLLPLLLLFWLLGWLFEWFKRQGYLDRIAELERVNKKLKSNAYDLEKELRAVKSEFEKVSSSYNEMRSKNADLDIKLRSCNEQRTNLETQLAVFDENKMNLNTNNNNDDDDSSILSLVDGGSAGDDISTNTENVGIGASFNKNDLQVIEGIGPKIEHLLHQGGITTWAELAASSVERIQEILTAAGGRYRLAKPTTWPKQAALAADGKWAELKSYQDTLDGGK